MTAPTLAAGISPPPGSAAPVLRHASYRDSWTWFTLTVLARGYLAFMVTLGCIAVVPTIFGWQSFVVQTDSMEPRISPGDVVVTSTVSGPDSVAMGRVVAFNDVNRPGASAQAPVLVVHRVVSPAEGGGFITRGDHNQSNDSGTLARDSIVGLGRILVPFAGLPIIWWAQGAYALLFIWLLFTVVAAIVVAISPRWIDDPDAADPPPRDWTATSPTDSPPLAARPSVLGLLGGRRMAFVRAVVIATVLAIMAAIGVRTADAAFSATTGSVGNTWTAAVNSYLTSANFTTYYTAGSGNGSVSWSGSTVSMSKIATILSTASQANVTFNVTGSMPTSATQRGYSLWARASATGSGSSTRITGYEFRLDDERNRFVFTWWNKGVERSVELAGTDFPGGFDAKAAHAVSLTLYNRSVQATIDGSIVLTYTLPTSPASFNGSNVALPSGGRYGLRTFHSSSVVRGTQMTAFASTGIAGMGMALMALDCPLTDAMLASPAPADPVLLAPTVDPTPSDLASESAVVAQPADPAADLMKDVSATDKAVVVDAPQPTVTPSADPMPDPVLTESANPEPTVTDEPVDPAMPAAPSEDLGLALVDPCLGVLMEPDPSLLEPSAEPTPTADPSPAATPTDQASPSPSAVLPTATPDAALPSEVPTSGDTPLPVSPPGEEAAAPLDPVSPASPPEPVAPSVEAASVPGALPLTPPSTLTGDSGTP